MNIQKNHNLISIGTGIAFLVLLQEFAAVHPIYRILAPSFVVFLIAVFFYNRWFLHQKGKINGWMQIRPLTLFLGAFGIFFFIPSDTLKGYFLVLSVFIIYFFEFFLGNFSENILLNETLFIAFGFFFSLMASVFYFPKFYILYVILCFVGTFVIARSSYEFNSRTEQTKLIASAVLGFLCTEGFVTLNFLPFHFSILSLLLVSLFYFGFILNYYHLLNILNYKKLIFNILFLLLVNALVLLATPWKIIS